MKSTFKFLALLLAVSHFSFGQDVTKKIDSIVKGYHLNNPKVGISIGFIQNNNEYYTAYGNLSRESNTNINKNSVFEIASITKIITSNLIAQAVNEQKINTDDYIDNYLPKQYVLDKNIKQKIKISDLASHQSGLPDIDFRELIIANPQQPVKDVTRKTLSNMINNCSELVDYGQYRYSTVGYTLLGQILETLYNKSYDDILREKLITPLQMTNTLTTDSDVDNKTIGYNTEGGSQEFFNWSVVAPAGLVKSNASDMVLYLKALLNKENGIAKAAMLTEKVYYKSEKGEIGLGINILKDGSNTLYLKSGDSMGQSSMLCYNRDQNWGIIILLNQRNSKLRGQLLNDIYENILKKKVE